MSDIIKVPEKEIEKYGEGALTLVQQSESISVTNESEAEQASLFLNKVGAKVKELEDQRTSLVKPFNDGVKAINEMFKRYTIPLTTAKSIVGNKILAWKRAEDEKIAKEEARRQAIQKAHEEKGHQVNEPIELQRTAKKIGFAQTKKVWKFKLENFADLPDEFKMICEPAINRKIQEMVKSEQTPVIKGLSIFQEDVIGASRY